MRTPPLLADFTHIRVCKPFCENSLTLPSRLIAAYTSEKGGTKNTVDYAARKGVETVFVL